MRHKLTGHDHAALLIAHIACTDKQLHNREIKQLTTFLSNDASDVVELPRFGGVFRACVPSL